MHLSRTNALRHTDLAQIAQKTGRFLLVRYSAPHLQNISWPTLPPTTSTAWPIPTNRPAILNNPSNPYTIGERDGPENIEQDYKGTRETCRPVVFSEYTVKLSPLGTLGKFIFSFSTIICTQPYISIIKFSPLSVLRCLLQHKTWTGLPNCPFSACFVSN